MGRSVRILKHVDGKFHIQFWDMENLLWDVKSYVVLTNVIEKWLNEGVHPEYRYT